MDRWRHSKSLGRPVRDRKCVGVGTRVAGSLCVGMRALDSSLQQFGEFLLRAQLVTPRAAPYCVRWVRTFLNRAATDEPIADQVRHFCEELEGDGRREDWQVRQADYALRLYFVNFLQGTDWSRQTGSAAVDADGRVNALLAMDHMRSRLRSRHYAYRTEGSYIDWARRFLANLSERQAQPEPRVDTRGVQDFLTHLAVKRRVSSSSQNQALSALLFLCREVLGLDLGDLSQVARARRGNRLPVVLSVPETHALLNALRGRAWLMAALIYGGGLRVSECCELRVKDVDFDHSFATHLLLSGVTSGRFRNTSVMPMSRRRRSARTS